MPHRPSVDPQLLSLTVHEFRTPITIVAGYLRMILRDSSTPLNESQRRMIEEAERSCGRLAGLVAELSDLSNLSAGTATFNRQPVEIFSLLEEAISAMSDPAAGPVLSQDQSSGPARVNGDAVRLRQALQSVLVAIRRELPPATSLIVERRVQEVQGKPMASILIGAAAAVQQLAGARASALGPFNIWRGGSGLSLVIADRVLADHGGRLASLKKAPKTEPGGAIFVPLAD